MLFTRAYEGLLGWRYLLRQARSYHVLLVGLGLLILGATLAGGGVFWQHNQPEGFDLFGVMSPTTQALLALGGGLAVIGACVTFFGLLNVFLTVFASFSTFMITIGVAEVILVLGVMNGFQGDLRAKIIDTYAHVMIEPAQHGAHLSDYRALASAARQVEGVVGASPILEAEIMLSAPSNLSAVILSGVDLASLAETNHLARHLEEAARCPPPLDGEAKGPCKRWRGELRFLQDPYTLDEALIARAGLDPRRVSRPTAPPPPPLGDPMMPFPAPAQAAPGPPPSFFAGVELRRNLGLWPGETLNVISPQGDLGPNGPIPKSRPFRVAGFFESGMLLFDSKLIYATLPDVQRFLGLEDVAGAIQIRVEDLEEARLVRDRLRVALAGRDLKITDWQARNRSLFSALKLEKIAMFLVLSINILLAAFSITSTLVMTIIERKREVAILMAMGSSHAAILRIFMSQGAFTGALGSLLGAIIGLSGGLALSRFGLPLNTEVYYISAIPIDVRVIDVLSIILVALLVSLLSTVYPALYASRLRPVEGLNKQ
ncbi:ABC transporter permease [Myxococcota bacterium]|nr:ABC transporter permease [Myxococcota bacterium]MBU1899767.1 ABC transporter permease [Myxococcota bacterium]